MTYIAKLKDIVNGWFRCADACDVKTESPSIIAVMEEINAVVKAEKDEETRKKTDALRAALTRYLEQTYPTVSAVPNVELTHDGWLCLADCYSESCRGYCDEDMSADELHDVPDYEETFTLSFDDGHVLYRHEVQCCADVLHKNNCLTVTNGKNAYFLDPVQCGDWNRVTTDFALFEKWLCDVYIFVHEYVLGHSLNDEDRLFIRQQITYAENGGLAKAWRFVQEYEAQERKNRKLNSSQ